MNILITGGAGFIGSSIADAYLEAGHQVVILDNLTTGVLSNVPKRATFFQMDIRDEGVSEIIREHRIEIINHHAAQIDVRKSVENPQYDLSVNVLGSINLMEAAVQHGVQRFILHRPVERGMASRSIFPLTRSIHSHLVLRTESRKLPSSGTCIISCSSSS